jgi:hemerythrin superfamily protein
MDAIKLMKEDHQRLKALRKDAEKAEDGDKREGLLAVLRAEMAAHEVMEEQVFYPALKPHEVAHDVVMEGYEEHHVADILMDELMETNADSDVWKAKMKVLKEAVEHHIEEEEGDMFKKARKVLEPSQLEDLGRQMASLKS